MVPYYKLTTEEIGKSGRIIGRHWTGATMCTGGTYHIGGNWQKDDLEWVSLAPGLDVRAWQAHNFNPFRDLSHGGTTLGFNGKNYWYSDKSLIGKILKKIFI